MSTLRQEQENGRKLHYVRTVVREGEIVQVKFCPACGRDGICSTEGHSDFQMTLQRGKWRPASLCKRCLNERRRKRHAERVATDPEFRERHRQRCYEAHKRRAGRPDYREKMNAAAKRWRKRKKKQDPQYFREYKRMAYTLRREQEGKKVQRRATVIDGTAPRVRSEPFSLWFEAYRRSGGLEVKEAAHELGLSEKYVTRLRANAFNTTLLDLVCRALTNARRMVKVGGTMIVTLEDLYPEMGKEEK